MTYDELVAAIKSNATTALEYLRSQWERFRTLDQPILDLQHRAAVASYNARQAGDLERAEQARAMIRTLADLKSAHDRALNTMESVAGYVGLSGYHQGLGAIPAAQLTVITSLALVVAWAFRAYAAKERELELIEAGVLTPEDVARLNPGPAPAMVLGAAADVAKWLLAGLVVYVGWQLVQQFGPRKGGRPRRNPPLVVFDSNPPGHSDEAIGEEVLAVWYRHADDGHPYVHEFGSDVQLLAQPDGTVLLEHRGGEPLWADFGVDEDDLEEDYPFDDEDEDDEDEDEDEDDDDELEEAWA